MFHRSLSCSAVTPECRSLEIKVLWLETLVIVALIDRLLDMLYISCKLSAIAVKL
jgi:hypothetical protein